MNACRCNDVVKPMCLTQGSASSACITEVFWRNTKKQKGCWLWRGTTNSRGYGMVTVKRKQCNGHKRTKSFAAHRLAWMIQTKSPLPSAALVCHKCNTPNCERVHLKHAYLGTYKTNARDTSASGRCGRYVLTARAADDIRALHASGLYNYTQLSKRFDVSCTTSGKIVCRELWRSA